MDKSDIQERIDQLREEVIDEITAMFNCRRCERFGHCDISKLKGCEGAMFYYLGFGSGIIHALGDADSLKDAVKRELNKK